MPGAVGMHQRVNPAVKREVSMGGMELLVVKVCRALLEVALLALLGQGAVALLAGARRQQNPIYRLFAIITDPVIRAARAMVPQQIGDRHLPYVTFFVLLWLWLVLAWVKQQLLT
jgi:hypothetical protein